MKIFKDKVSGDELFSDTYPFELVDDVVYKVQGKHITEAGPSLDDNLFGGNASQEATEGDGLEESSTSGINVVLANRLVPTGFTKKQYQGHIKDYMKKIKERMHAEEVAQEEIDKFTKGAAKFVKELLGEFKEYDFFLGESMNCEAMAVPVRWDGETPYVYFFKHGIEEEKV